MFNNTLICRTTLTVAMSLLLQHSLPSHAQTQSPPPQLMPLPAQIQRNTGSFLVDGSFGVALEGYTEPRLDRAKQRFLKTLTRETGIPLWRTAVQNKPHFFIKTTGPSQPVQQSGEDESYHLQIASSEVHLEAATPLGVLRGLQTFLQLVAVTPDGFSVPAMTIDDKPRFPWRGLMIDSGRHFMPLEVIKRNLDGMEAVKMNVFHWHLSDDQGFRAESKKYPLLQEKGSDGLYYTQAQMREIIEYARDRGIRVVPEFDMPGHATSWFVGYPELASGKGPYQIERHWGIFDPAMDPTRESTYKFLDGFIGEMAALFPDAYFHIGGDECNGKEWDANPRIQEFMRAHGLKDDVALQAYFTANVQKIVTKHKKIMEGWDEVLQPETPKDVVIQSWRGQDSIAEAARNGHEGLLSAGYYLDLNQPAREHYSIDPMAKGAANLSSEEKQRILGGEAAMWSEFVSPENIDSRIWPRAAAIAERLWSPQQVQDIDSLYDRLEAVSQHLDNYGLKHRSSYGSMLRRMTGNPDPVALRVLGDVVEPPKQYVRGQLRSYDSFTPLNHLVDAVPPESNAARQFHDMVERIVAKKATAQDLQQAQQWLMLWRDNDARLQPALAKSELTKELIPVSSSLHQVAEAGLQALEYMRTSQPSPAVWRNEQLALLAAAQKPEAILLNMVAPSVAELVQATTPQQ